MHFLFKIKHLIPNQLHLKKPPSKNKQVCMSINTFLHHYINIDQLLYLLIYKKGTMGAIFRLGPIKSCCFYLTWREMLNVSQRIEQA